ncbi:bifunctional folylpolyglutamate synthase/dihydrofolate synthase [Oscillospiraceae bacterium LTW-04]|nr:folylpolyglutamate synthase/dihydrofolate synthase family protein [Oscillospiraceae bacterium MB24-C1]
MTYEQALAAIHQTPWEKSIPGLKRIGELMQLLGNPQDTLNFVHIAGSNGKGSVAAMTASVLQQAGYVTGLCTSPYITRFNERIRINGASIPDDDLVVVTEKVLACAKKMQERPTEFELVSAITFTYFAERHCDIVVLEVGLGGRMDATNIIKSPLVAAITAIGLEHTAILGDTVEKIAAEKAGIIKPGTTAVISDQPENIIGVIADICRERQVPLFVAEKSCVHRLSQGSDGQQLLYRGDEIYHLPLLGAHQLQNVSTVLSIIQVLRQKGFAVSQQAVGEGLKNTRWPGRFELLQRSPDFFVDGGHNPQCAGAVEATLRELFPNQKICFLLGVLTDKNYRGIIEPALSIAKHIVTITPPSPRAMAAQELSKLLQRDYGVTAEPCTTIAEGVAKILAQSKPLDVICAYGSLYSVGEIRACFGFNG